MKRQGRDNPRHQRGLTLIELTLTIVVLGIIGVLVARWIMTSNEQRRDSQQRSLLQRTDDALTSYISVHHHLPCPALDAEGIGDCSLSDGNFPYRDVGLPDRRASAIRYAVYRNADAASSDVDMPSINLDLADKLDRAPRLEMMGGGIIAMVKRPDTCFEHPEMCERAPDLGINGLDFCYALRSAMNMAPSSQHLHVEHRTTTGARIANVAYALSAGNPDSKTMALKFPSPRAGNSAENLETTRAVGFEQLWSRLRCAEASASALHAHANAAAAADINVPAMNDYAEQLSIMVELAEAGDLSADADMTLAVAQIFSATSGLYDTASEAANTMGGFSWRIAIAGAGLGSALGATVAAATMKGLSVTNVNKAKSAEKAFSEGEAGADGLPYPLKSKAVELVQSSAVSSIKANMLGLAPGAQERKEVDAFGRKPASP